MQPCLPCIKASALNAAFLLILSVVSTVAGPRYSSRIVETKSGAIRGIIVEPNSKHLEPVEVFRGVPYAAPPTKENRFMPPYPPVPWPGTRLADTFPPVCPQRVPDVSNKTIAFLTMPRGRYLQLRKLVPLLQNQSEDCLYLNMYIPISDVMRKRRITFYGHLSRMDPGRLSNKIFRFFLDKKVKPEWFLETKRDLEELRITRRDLEQRDELRRRLEPQGFRHREKLKTGKAWTEERRQQQRERMKEYWRKRKEEAGRRC